MEVCHQILKITDNFPKRLQDNLGKRMVDCSLYAQNKRKLIFPYNKWDFEVTLNMICSDMLPLLKEWFPDDSDKMLEQKMVQLAVNWINDEDNPYGESKIWCYFSR